VCTILFIPEVALDDFLEGEPFPLGTKDRAKDFQVSKFKATLELGKENIVPGNQNPFPFFMSAPPQKISLEVLYCFQD
jgi:hypothetical protein